MLDIRNLLGAVHETVQKHSLGEPGKYRRWLWQDEKKERHLGINEYGCADAANILYTIGCFPENLEEKAQWIEALQSLQNPETGLFYEKTHDPLHTTAHLSGALNLFDARVKYPIKALHYLQERKKLISFLESLHWQNNPWLDSQKGAGIYATLVLNNEVGLDWQRWYFDWLWENADPVTGFWRTGFANYAKNQGIAPIFHHLAGSFHYLFNHEYAHMPIRYPHKVVDSCLEILKNGCQQEEQPILGSRLGRGIGFSDIDWVYCLNRSQRQCGHRYKDCRQALKSFAEKYIHFLLSVHPETHDDFNDLHWLFGMVCALAELQQALPGCIITEKPLQLVLDRRPFI